MSYKTILVCLSTEQNAEPLTKMACLVAKKFGAKIRGVHTLQSIEVYPGVAMYIDSDVTRNFNQSQEKTADKIRATFTECADSYGIEHTWELIRDTNSDAGDKLAEEARCADLVVMGQANYETDRADQGSLQRTVIEGSGRPVLVVPRVGTYDHVGENPLIGWSATREATRALHDALPFLEKAGKAKLLWMASSDKEAARFSSSAQKVANSLEQRDIETQVSPQRKVDIGVGDALLNEAADMGADLIVTGAFGHSRFYDFVIGAATSHLLAHMTAPVLFSK